jgi:ATP-dependent Clp protease ATP-binding subunit ClpX
MDLSDQLTTAETQRLGAFLREVPEITPLEIVQQARDSGYIGQDIAVRSLALMAFRHVDRIRNIVLRNMRPADLPPKDNFLLLGPTGCGKTFLVEIIFNRILKIPTVVVDITNYSETGYIGQDVVTLLTRLVNAAGGDPALASIGIIAMDEFDKLATGQNNAVFSGAGTTKDVSGFGVQRELLKMLEGAAVAVPDELSHSSYARREVMRTDNIAFIALGAFSGIAKTIEFGQKNIGFKRGARVETGKSGGRIAYQIAERELKISHFQDYGIIPELMGRFSRIVPFAPLGREDLKNILHRNLLQLYALELGVRNSRLDIAPDVLDRVVQQALDRETGARGIKMELQRIVEDAMFDFYSQKCAGRTVRVFADGAAGFAWEIL